jgi:putative SOS response-associated peptidase YedK
MKKQKYLLHLPESKMLYLAGFYSSFQGQHSFVILTTAANCSISDYHDRMPLIFHTDMMGSWLKDRDFALDYVQKPYLSNLGAIAV